MPLGSHLHLYFRQNDATSMVAVTTFTRLATAYLKLPQAICADDFGHEQSHNHTCWLSGPGGHESPFPQDNNGSSFVTGVKSLYIHNRDFANVLSFLTLQVNREALGADLDFLLHPCFGCNFADHQLFSLHRGTSTPNNLFGIEREGGWNQTSVPPSIDPLAVDVDGSDGNALEPTSFDVHVLYSPLDVGAVRAKKRASEDAVSACP